MKEPPIFTQSHEIMSISQKSLVDAFKAGPGPLAPLGQFPLGNPQGAKRAWPEGSEVTQKIDGPRKPQSLSFWVKGLNDRFRGLSFTAQSGKIPKVTSFGFRWVGR
jgi:hypothetical protein